MKKIIWTCWIQGRDAAPPVVQGCLRSWERSNPGWEFRCLDSRTIERYVPLGESIDLQRQSLTAASLSDVLRVMLLHEYGGVWVDATLWCNRALDDWLPDAMQAGFFAFDRPSRTRPLASWFLSAEPGHPLVSTWHRRTLAFWSGRTRTDDYFWFHHLYRDMLETDPECAAWWERVPKISADGPHALQVGGLMHAPHKENPDVAGGTTAVFKLTHRLPQGVRPDSVLARLLERHAADEGTLHGPADTCAAAPGPRSFASLKVSTQNLGDHIQILAASRLLSRLGVQPSALVDRDHEIQSAPHLDAQGPVGIVLNGWFKSNRAEWPPHPKLLPLVIGFHIRLFKCPELLSPASIEFFRRHAPIGCRDAYTESLLRAKGVDAFISHCLTLTLPKRVDDPARQTEVFVVSRDERITQHLPSALGRYTFVSHYSGSFDFEANMAHAAELLQAYRSRARLIVTTLLHCALPAIAMGIPVVVLYPLNDPKAHASDRERFSSLETLVPVQTFEQLDEVDWNPSPVDVSEVKLRLVERFDALATARWQLPPPRPLEPIAPPARI